MWWSKTPGHVVSRAPYTLSVYFQYRQGVFRVNTEGKNTRALVEGGETELLMSARAVCSCQGLHLGGLIFPEAKRMGFLSDCDLS